MNNVETFSSGSGQYARYRPAYPQALFAYLNETASGHACAWDCGTGSGQAAISCAEYFTQVEATDISVEQIRHCLPHPRVHYSVSPAEATGFEADTFDLILVAQAYHWFDREKFAREAGRVLKPGGLLAVCGYGFFEIEPGIDRIIRESLFEPVDRFWAEGNRILMGGYRDVSLPFDEIRGSRDFGIELEWDLPHLLEYLRTWSAVKRFEQELGVDPVSRLEMELLLVWPDPQTHRPVRMPLFLRLSRKPA
jgi:SAM-dependent methyltransferase